MRRATVAFAAPALLALLAAAAGCAKRPLPVTAPAAPASLDAARPVEGARVVRHTVKAGETLARIADNYYGDPARAADIARANGLDPGREPAPDSVLDLAFAPAEWVTAERRAVALDPYNRGVQALAQDRLGEAERLFRLAVETAPDLPDARYNLALVLLRRGRAEEAIDLLATLAAQRPADLETRCALGNALFQAARFAEAATQFATVLRERPEHRRAAFGHARALQEAGRRAEAVAAWRRYLELDADSNWADVAREQLRKPADGR